MSLFFAKHPVSLCFEALRVFSNDEWVSDAYWIWSTHSFIDHKWNIKLLETSYFLSIFHRWMNEWKTCDILGIFSNQRLFYRISLWDCTFMSMLPLLGKYFYFLCQKITIEFHFNLTHRGFNAATFYTEWKILMG